MRPEVVLSGPSTADYLRRLSASEARLIAACGGAWDSRMYAEFQRTYRESLPMGRRKNKRDRAAIARCGKGQ